MTSQWHVILKADVGILNRHLEATAKKSRIRILVKMSRIRNTSWRQDHIIFVENTKSGFGLESWNYQCGTYGTFITEIPNTRSFHILESLLFLVGKLVLRFTLPPIPPDGLQPGQGQMLRTRHRRDSGAQARDSLHHWHNQGIEYGTFLSLVQSPETRYLHFLRMRGPN